MHRSAYGYWLLTRYDDIAAAFRDPRLSSDWSRKRRPAPHPDDPFARAQAVVFHSFNMSDPPTHTRLRALVQQAFTRAAVDHQRDRIVSLVDELLDEGAARGTLDLVTELAFPLTITIASETIGIPADERERFRSSFEDTERLGDPTATPEQRRAGQDALVWQLGFIGDVVDARRADPRDDLVSALVQAEEHGETLTRDEILAALLTIYTAGGTTTERMISSGMLLLLRHPEQWAALTADPSLVPAAITEILRYHHPAQQTTTNRLAIDDVEIRGVTIPAGSTVRLALGAANRDPARWDDPERFDVRRPELVSLAFGQGIHYCIGAPLARLQATIAVQRLAERFPRLALAGGEVRHDPKRMDRYEHVVVELEP